MMKSQLEIRFFVPGIKGWFLKIQMYPKFADFFLNYWKAFVIWNLISFTKKYEVKVLHRLFCKGLPNCASHTS